MIYSVLLDLRHSEAHFRQAASHQKCFGRFRLQRHATLTYNHNPCERNLANAGKLQWRPHGASTAFSV
jgi:hypothetical protein